MNLTFMDKRFGAGEEVSVTVDFYAATDGVAIMLKDADGMPYAAASVCLPDHQLPEDCVAIKDYSENEGMAKLLVDQGIIKNEVAGVAAGFSVIPIYRMSAEFLEYVQDARMSRSVALAP